MVALRLPAVPAAANDHVTGRIFRNRTATPGGMTFDSRTAGRTEKRGRGGPAHVVRMLSGLLDKVKTPLL